MKYMRFYILLMFLTLTGLSMKAQTANIISVPDITAQIGEAQLLVNLENSSDIVALQFDLTLPQGMTAEETATLSNRCDDHVVTVRNISGDTYRVVLVSPSNRPIRGQSGVVMYIHVFVPDTFEEESDYPLTIANAVLGKASGENVLTEATAGVVHVTKMSHLTVNAKKTELYEGEKTIVTVTNEFAPESDLTLTVSTNSPERIALPQNVVMAAGSTTATFEIEVLQDTEVTDTLTAVITLSADNHYDGECSLRLIDDDRCPIVETNKAAYKPGETVLITGQMYGLAALDTKAAIYIVHNGKREKIDVRTDSKGSFTAAYNIPSTQSGHFGIEVCLAGEEGSEELGSFDTFGIQLSSYRSETYIELESPYTGTITVSNTVNMEQTELKIEQQGDSVNCAFDFIVPEEIVAGGSVEIAYTITANALSEGSDWHQMPIEITTAEGGKATYTFYYYVRSASAILKAEPAVIETTMTKGATREYPLVITNTGKGETGTITLGLPPFMKTATPLEMPSLASGESTTVLLEMTPTEEMTVNVPVTGNLAINCKNGNGLSVEFSLEPVSATTGTVSVDVTDELTYYAETVKAPHVKNAKIEIKHPVTNEVVATGTSDEEGRFSTELAEGLYVLEVSAPKHETYTNRIIIDPGKAKSFEAFLSYTNVTYDWNVEETETEDTYNLELVADYDVRIPKPALDVKIGIDEQPFDGTIIPIEVTNKGLININDVDVSLVVTPDDYSLEFQNSPHFDYLAPHQTETVFALVKYNRPAEARRTEGGKNDPGVGSAAGKGKGEYPCGDNNEEVRSTALKFWGITTEQLAGLGEMIDALLGQLPSTSPSEPNKPEQNTYSTVVSTYDVDVPVSPDKTEICYNPTNPDDINNPNRPDDPIGLPIAPSGLPDGDMDCNNHDEPVFVYNIVPVSGTQYKLKGVAADGVSQVKLVLDPEKSHIPKEDCDTFTDFEWYVRKEYGKIEGSSFKEAIYTAPDSFPEGHSSYFDIVEAVMSYTHHYNSSVSEVKHVTVEIEIIRPPVVFLHGLIDTEQCWKDLDSLLIRSGMYRDSINYRVDYTPTNTYSFNKNVPVVGLGIQKAQRRALCRGYVATKCDLVGHSMGGILARLFVQNGGEYYGSNTKEVNRIITVNTPHAGSEIASTVMGHDKFIGWVAEKILNHIQSSHGFDTKTSLGAIKDLDVESDAIINLNVDLSPKPTVPVCAVATSLEESSNKMATMAIGASFAVGVASVAASSLETGPIATWIGIPLGVLAFTYATHVMGQDMTQVGVGDWVVSEQSQIGGCSSNVIIGENGTGGEILGSLGQKLGLVTGGIIGAGIMESLGYIYGSALTEPWHVKSPKHEVVLEVLKELLSRNASDSIFSTSWFQPKQRHFDHNWSTWAWIGSAIPIPWRKLDGQFRRIPDLGSLLSDGQDGWNLGESGADLLKNVQTYKKASSSSRSSQPMRTAMSEEQYIRLKLNNLDGFSDPIVSLAFGTENAAVDTGYEVDFKIPSTFSGEAKLMIIMKNEDGNSYYEEYVFNVEEPLATPVSLSLEETVLNVDDSEPLRLYCTWNDGSETKVVPDSITFEYGNMAAQVGKYIVGLRKGRTKATAYYRGLSCEGLVRVFGTAEEDDDESSEAVCSSVTLSFKQEMVTTRQAFRGTLTVNNASGSKQLKDLKLNLEVKDEMGNVATEHEFQIDAETLEGFNGEVDLTAGWSLDAESKGMATILFIPTKNAAPTEPKKWWFGGTFSYTDPDSGLPVTRELHAVPLTVNPTAELALDYFLQRDVYGDDPLTEDVVEESRPAEFALLINNKGYGDARNVNMMTQKPEIVDNEKGLLIDFDLVSSQLNGDETTLALGKTIPTDFGTIPAHSQAYAQWWLQSSLLGHFTTYDVNAIHVSGNDNPDLSLLDEVNVHELIHGFTVSTDDDKPLRGFLVNDMPDSQDKPDAVYFTDATHQDAYLATETSMEQLSYTKYILTVKRGAEGWNYGSTTDPTDGRQKLLKVECADGRELCVDNFWQTDRTLRDGKDPLCENRLHFVCDMTAESESFTLTFEPAPDNYAKQTMALAEGWNWVSSYLNEPLPIGNLATHASRILSQTDELILDPELGMVGSIETMMPGWAYKVQARNVFEVVFSGHLHNSADNPITLFAGWNWIAYPFAVSHDPNTIIANAEEGDYITAQQGFSEYSNGTWEGDLYELTPGQGYLYKSASTKQLQFDFTETPAGSRMANYPPSTIHHPLSSAVDPHQYPSTMNITARIYRDGMELPGSQYTVYAYAGNELRGVSQFVGSNHYLTVYGDEPVNISFIVESAETGETFAAAETLTFVSDVVGSRKSPYAVSISTTTGISQQMTDTPMAIYTLDGILVSRDATIRTLQTLPKGVYIVNGRKTVVK